MYTVRFGAYRTDDQARLYKAQLKEMPWEVIVQRSKQAASEADTTGEDFAARRKAVKPHVAALKHFIQNTDDAHGLRLLLETLSDTNSWTVPRRLFQMLFAKVYPNEVRTKKQQS